MPLLRSLEQFAYDLRHAVRALWSGRGAAVVLVATLALGIGINTAMFTIVNALLVRPLPVRDPSSLYAVTLGNFCSYGWVERQDTLNYDLWKELRADRRVFSTVFAYAPALLDVSTGNEVRIVGAAYASSEMWNVLDVRPIVGRTIASADERLGSASAVALIGEAFWDSEFGRDPAIVGRSLKIGGRPVTVIGVAPRYFPGLYVGTRADLFLPLEASAWLTSPGDPLGPTNGQHWWIVAAGRLRPGLSLDAARQQLAAWSPAAMRRTIPPDWPRHETGIYFRQRFEVAGIGRGFSYVRDRLSEPLLVASGLLVLLLLLACANVATLQLGRGLARQREYAVRLALGASRLRLGWQVLLESLVSAGAGALVGLALAYPTTHALAALYDTRFESLQLDLHPDAYVVAFTASLAIVTALLFGLAPAVQAMRTDAHGTLTSARGAGAVEPVRHWLVTVQVSLAVVLASIALLFGASLTRLTGQDKGFSTSGVVLADIDAGRAGLEGTTRAAFYRTLLDRLSELPPVASVAASYVTPLSGSTWQSSLSVEDAKGRRDAHAFFHVVTPGYFDTYRTRIVAGRPFSSRDALGSAQVALVNEAFARGVLGGESLSGRRLRCDLGETMKLDAEIVGIVADAKYRNLRAPVPPTVYVAMAQDPTPPAQIAIGLRAKGSVSDVLSASRRALEQTHPAVSYQVRSYDEQLADSVVNERAMASVTGLFGILALLLASVGIYGLAAYSVRQRQPEIGVRMALGATAGRILILLFTGTGKAIAAGALVGVVLAVWGARIASALLYSVTPGSVPVYLLAVGVLVLAGAVAVVGPALRAAHVDPAQTLRME